jgi:hypothetical protein
MLAQLAAAMLSFADPSAAPAVQIQPDVQVQVDSVRHEITLTAGHIHIPGGTGYGHEHAETNVHFVWPAGGWARGYRIDIVDSLGHLLPRDVLHHAGIANLDRRTLPYPVAERLLAAGRETPAMMLPASMGIPLSAGQHMVLYYMLVNPDSLAIEGAALRVTIAWTPDGDRGPASVYPMFLDANPSSSGSRVFDLAPGRSVTSAEFTLPVGGYLRAVSGHLHDYAVELRLEDAESNCVLARVRTTRDSGGHLLGVETHRFLFRWRGLHLDENHRYRVVSVYDNPTGETIHRGAMAFMVGPFIPDDVRRWPLVDPTDPRYQEDYEGFNDPVTPQTHAHHKA